MLLEGDMIEFGRRRTKEVALTNKGMNIGRTLKRRQNQQGNAKGPITCTRVTYNKAKLT